MRARDGGATKKFSTVLVISVKSKNKVIDKSSLSRCLYVNSDVYAAHECICTALARYCTVLYCTVLYCTSLHPSLDYHSALSLQWLTCHCMTFLRIVKFRSITRLGMTQFNAIITYRNIRIFTGSFYSCNTKHIWTSISFRNFRPEVIAMKCE